MEKTNQNSNKEVAQKFLELFEQGRRDEVKKLFAENYQLQFPGKTEKLNRDQSIELMKQYNNAFPDMKISVQLQVAEGDFVVTRYTAKATHKGEFQGIAPTNKKVSASGTVIQRIVNNKIVDEIVEFDALGLIQQIGGLWESSKLASAAASSVH